MCRTCYIHIRAYFFSSFTHIRSSCTSSFSALLCRPTLIAGNAQDKCFLLVAGSLFPISLLLDIHTTLTMLLTLSYQRHNLQSSLKCWCLSTTCIKLTAVGISYYNFHICISKFYLQQISQRISLVHMHRTLHPTSFGNFSYPSSRSADT